MIMQQVSDFSVKLAGKKVCDVNLIGFCKSHNTIVMIRLKDALKLQCIKTLLKR